MTDEKNNKELQEALDEKDLDKVTGETNDYPLKPKADKGAKKNEGLPPWIV